MILRLVGLEDAFSDEPIDVRVVLREVGDRRTANAIQPAIADMSKIKVAVVEGERSAGRAHAAQVRVVSGTAADRFVGSLESVQKSSLRVRGRFQVDVPNNFHRQAAGHLTAFVAAHAVSHNGEPALPSKVLVAFRLAVAEVVFVLLALTTGIGEVSQLDSGSNLHHGKPPTSPVRGT